MNNYNIIDSHKWVYNKKICYSVCENCGMIGANFVGKEFAPTHYITSLKFDEYIELINLTCDEYKIKSIIE